MDIINHSTSVPILGLRVTGLDAFFYLRPPLQPLFSSSLSLLSCFLNLAKPEPIEVFICHPSAFSVLLLLLLLRRHFSLLASQPYVLA